MRALCNVLLLEGGRLGVIDSKLQCLLSQRTQETDGTY